MIETWPWPNFGVVQWTSVLAFVPQHFGPAEPPRRRQLLHSEPKGSSDMQWEALRWLGLAVCRSVGRAAHGG